MGIQTMSMGQKAAANNMTKLSVNNAEATSGIASMKASAGEVMRDLSFTEQKLQAFEEWNEGKGEESTPFQKRFDLAMGGIIVANVVWIAVEIDFGPEEGTPLSDRYFWFTVNSCFLATFIIEIFVRMSWENWDWIYGLWNWFDTIIVLCAIFDVWLLALLADKFGSLHALSILRLARLVRLVRMVKLVRTMHSLYVMVMAFLNALKGMCSLACIMFFGILIYSIIGTLIIGRNKEFEDVKIYDDTVPDRFGSVYSSMYSLFELMTLEGWQLVARPLVERNPLCFLFIGSFIMIFTYGLLNMVVATVVEKTLQQTNELKAFDQKMELHNLRLELLAMKSMFMEGDGEDSGSLSKEQFMERLDSNDVLKSNLEHLGVPTQDVKELFVVLDCDGDEQLRIEEIVEGVGKLNAGQLSVWDGLATLQGVKGLRADVADLRQDMKEVKQRQAKMDAHLEEQGHMIREILTCVRYSLKSPPPPSRGVSARIVSPVEITPPPAVEITPEMEDILAHAYADLDMKAHLADVAICKPEMNPPPLNVIADEEFVDTDANDQINNGNMADDEFSDDDPMAKMANGNMEEALASMADAAPGPDDVVVKSPGPDDVVKDA